MCWTDVLLLHICASVYCNALNVQARVLFSVGRYAHQISYLSQGHLYRWS